LSAKLASERSRGTVGTHEELVHILDVANGHSAVGGAQVNGLSHGVDVGQHLTGGLAGVFWSEGGLGETTLAAFQALDAARRHRLASQEQASEGFHGHQVLPVVDHRDGGLSIGDVRGCRCAERQPLRVEMVRDVRTVREPLPGTAASGFGRIRHPDSVSPLAHASNYIAVVEIKTEYVPHYAGFCPRRSRWTSQHLRQ
jgi:hypothetical protein